MVLEENFAPFLFFLEGVIGLALAGGVVAATLGALMVMYRSRRR